MGEIGLSIAILTAVIWLGLLVGWGQFWRCDQRLEEPEIKTQEEVRNFTESYPTVCAVIPARNEAAMLPTTLRSLLQQDYPGSFQIVLVDDHSTDGTGAIAQQTALDHGIQLTVMQAEPLPAGWSGKLWAMEQGFQKASGFAPDYILLTDADIEHDPANLSRLVAKAQQQNLAMASVMVRLRCESLWEKLLIPAFVFFFQKIYPFRWVNNPKHPMAAAAGGCILIRRDVLAQIGGMQVIRQALIDDCALAQAVKGQKRQQKRQEDGEQGSEEAGKPEGSPIPQTSNLRPQTSTNIWLGLSDRTQSLRPYDTLDTIWEMVARTAFTQLSYSPWLLIGTMVGMTLIYLVPTIAVVVGLVLGNGAIALAGLTGWLLMSLAYYPTIRFYRCTPGLAFCLPAIAFLYTLMTLDSALRHWRGKGGAWKGRVYTLD